MAITAIVVGREALAFCKINSNLPLSLRDLGPVDLDQLLSTVDNPKHIILTMETSQVLNCQPLEVLLCLVSDLLE